MMGTSETSPTIELSVKTQVVAAATTTSSQVPAAGTSSTIKISSTTELTLYPMEPIETIVGINLLACACPSDNDRAPVDVVVVADVSGSMAGPKLALLKDTIKLLLDEFVAKDRVGLVSFSSRVNECVPLRVLTSEASDSAKIAVGHLRAGGKTNLSGGLFEGISQLTNCAEADRTNMKSLTEPASPRCRTVLLMTDGQAGIGVTKAEQFAPIIQEMLKDSGITVHTFGYGADHDSGLLRSIASSGNGSYYYVEGVDDIRSAFGDCLGGLLSVVAQNLKLTVEAPNGVTITKVHHKAAVEVGVGRWEIKYSDLYGEEERDLLVALSLPAATSDGPVNVLSCSLSFVDFFAELTLTELTTSVLRSREVVLVEDQNRNPQLVLQSTRLRVAETLENARTAAERGDLEAARTMVEDSRQHVESSSLLYASAKGAEVMTPVFFEDLAECAEGLKDTVSFLGKRHRMAMLAEGHQQQRCMESSATASGGGGGGGVSSHTDVSSLRGNSYRTSAKSAIATKFLSSDR